MKKEKKVESKEKQTVEAKAEKAPKAQKEVQKEVTVQVVIPTSELEKFAKKAAKGFKPAAKADKKAITAGIEKAFFAQVEEFAAKAATKLVKAAKFPFLKSTTEDALATLAKKEEKLEVIRRTKRLTRKKRKLIKKLIRKKRKPIRRTKRLTRKKRKQRSN